MNRLRRRVIVGAGLGPLTCPLAALAQPQPRQPRIGYLSLSRFTHEVAQTTPAGDFGQP